ncbi:hypothetical protein F2Q70_00033975 [Brassica cretica]|uniref:TIP41-like protein n=1 Tax=Brassica cretica TaxID=69181 RepID=A0A8S9JYJ1_BRACR|nr:hypothetical protein F2Q70_00033975 [Brassica cretica]
MEAEVDKEILKSAGAELLPDGRKGLRIHGWEIETIRGTILTSLAHEQYSNPYLSHYSVCALLWEEKLKTSHLPEMVFGENALVLKHLSSNTKIHFNAFDALAGWKQEGLPPVEVPAAAKWKFRSKPSQQVILDYDYTFTTPYSGSGVVEKDQETVEEKAKPEGEASLKWENCEEQIDLAALSLKEPILFYDEVVLYEDELADNGVSLLTVKVSHAKFMVSPLTILEYNVINKTMISNHSNLSINMSIRNGENLGFVNRRRGKEDWEGRRRGTVAGGGRRDGALAVAETKERAADPALRQAIVILATSCRINRVIRSIPKK